MAGPKTIAIVLAGGKGERLAPMTNNTPKPFLRLFNEKETLLENTLNRLDGGLISDVYVVASMEHMERIWALQYLPPFHLHTVPETPVGAGSTYTALSLAMKWIEDNKESSFQENGSLILVTPVDHVITPTTAFERAVQNACYLFSERPDTQALIFGAKPTYFTSELGYVKATPDERVCDFIEKPPSPTALFPRPDGTWFWNTGIFLARMPFIQKVLKDTWDEKPYGGRVLSLDRMIWGRLFSGQDTCADEAPPEIAFMDLSEMCYWQDIGTWESLFRYLFISKQTTREHEDNLW